MTERIFPTRNNPGKELILVLEAVALNLAHLVPEARPKMPVAVLFALALQTLSSELAKQALREWYETLERPRIVWGRSALPERAPKSS